MVCPDPGRLSTFGIAGLCPRRSLSYRVAPYFFEDRPRGRAQANYLGRLTAALPWIGRTPHVRVAGRALSKMRPEHRAGAAEVREAGVVKNLDYGPPKLLTEENRPKIPGKSRYSEAESR